LDYLRKNVQPAGWNYRKIKIIPKDMVKSFVRRTVKRNIGNDWPENNRNIPKAVVAIKRPEK